MNFAKVYESARAFGVFFAGFLRGGVWLALWLTVGAIVVYVVRWPFFHDDIRDYFRYVAIIAGVLTFAAFAYTAGFWLFERSVIFRFIIAGVLLLSVLSTCSQDTPCIETRYVSC